MLSKSANFSGLPEHCPSRGKGWWRASLVGLFLVYGPGYALAAIQGFVADVKRSNANLANANAEGRIMMGEAGIRSESQVNGEPVVVIYQIKNQQVFTIWPNRRQFSRLADGRLDLKPPPMPMDAASPCQTDKNYQCTLRGQEQVEGRSVDHWEIRVNASGKEARQFHLWVDRELGVAIRERYDDGTLVEMRNIRPGAPEGQWFALPGGLQEVVAPSPGQGNR